MGPRGDPYPRGDYLLDTLLIQKAREIGETEHLAVEERSYEAFLRLETFLVRLTLPRG